MKAILLWTIVNYASSKVVKIINHVYNSTDVEGH